MVPVGQIADALGALNGTNAHVTVLLESPKFPTVPGDGMGRGRVEFSVAPPAVQLTLINPVIALAAKVH